MVHPRFGDTVRVATETAGRSQLVAEIDTGGTFSVQVDDEPGSTELAAQFARDLAAAALRFAWLGSVAGSRRLSSGSTLAVGQRPLNDHHAIGEVVH